MCEQCSKIPEMDLELGKQYGFCQTVFHPFYREDGWICCKCHTWNPLDRVECRRDRCKHPRCKTQAAT
jgi:hypothetical protein